MAMAITGTVGMVASPHIKQYWKIPITRNLASTQETPSVEGSVQAIDSGIETSISSSTTHESSTAETVKERTNILNSTNSNIEQGGGELDYDQGQAQDQASITSTSTDKYLERMHRFIAENAEELENFANTHKEEFEEVQGKLNEEVHAGRFDYENYQQQFRDLVDDHAIAKYTEAMQAFVGNHTESIEAFVAQNKEAVLEVMSAVGEAIRDGNIPDGQFDLGLLLGSSAAAVQTPTTSSTNASTSISDIDRATPSGSYTNSSMGRLRTMVEDFMRDFGVSQYRKEMHEFITTHMPEIAAFVMANRDAIASVWDKIQDRVNKGEFDFKNYQQQIADLTMNYAVDRTEDTIARKFYRKHSSESKPNKIPPLSSPYGSGATSAFSDYLGSLGFRWE